MLKVCKSRHQKENSELNTHEEERKLEVEITEKTTENSVKAKLKFFQERNRIINL